MPRETRGWVGEVVGFWFAELKPEDWWTKSTRVDQAIIRRFAPLHDRLAREAAPGSCTTAKSFLATVLVLDQLSRHIWRGQPRAFAQDDLALLIANRAIEDGFDHQLAVEQRRFLYLPFEHSEDRAVQAVSVALFATLEDADALHYAQLHKVIIDRFGRFPHRNAMLGRATTVEEAEFLKGPGSSF